jgi:signal transduction histidine kinase
MFSYPFLSALLFILYFSTAVLGLRIEPVSGFATLVWIPSGLSLAFLFRFGLQYWPAVTLGAIAANYVTGAPFLAALGISVGNTLEPLVGAYLLQRVVKAQPQLDRVKDVLGLIFFAALLSTLISATGGVTSLWLNDVVELSAYGATWFAWWSGDAVSVLIIAPLLLVWSTRPSVKITRRYLLELIILIGVMLLASFVVFGDIFYQDSTINRPRSYLIFPVLVWAALRFGQRTTVSIIFLLSIIATLCTALDLGPFSTGSPSDNLLNLQLFMGVAASTAMILAAAISERKLYESKKDEFISVASHELKTPLTSIKAFTQTLQLLFERKGDQQSSAHMSRVNRQVDRLNRLVVKLLDLTRIQEGRIILQKEKFIIGPLISEIADETSEVTHHKIMISGSTRTSVYADRDRIGRVLTNLLTNAAKYSPDADQILVKVTKKPDRLIIGIQDFGIGISQEDLKNVFDRFYQVGRKSTDERLDSLGLGLYIAKAIIERHDGKIWVRSSQKGKQRGSTFCFSLPLKSAQK